MGCVARTVGRKELEATPEALEAVKEEFRQVTETRKAFDLGHQMERQEILQRHPDALFVRAFVVSVLKHSEIPSRAKHKARLVALGNAIRDAIGEAVLEKIPFRRAHHRQGPKEKC